MSKHLLSVVVLAMVMVCGAGSVRAAIISDPWSDDFSWDHTTTDNGWDLDHQDCATVTTTDGKLGWQVGQAGSSYQAVEYTDSGSDYFRFPADVGKTLVIEFLHDRNARGGWADGSMVKFLVPDDKWGSYNGLQDSFGIGYELLIQGASAATVALRRDDNAGWNQHGAELWNSGSNTIGVTGEHSYRIELARTAVGTAVFKVFVDDAEWTPVGGVTDSSFLPDTYDGGYTDWHLYLSGEGNGHTIGGQESTRLTWDDVSVETPEPATMGLLGLGSLGIAVLRRRRK